MIPALVAALALAAGGAAGTQPAVAWHPCSSRSELLCGYVAAPLDPTGKHTGRVRLYVQLLRAPRGHATSSPPTLFLVTGGPGGASTQTFGLGANGAVLQQIFPGYDLVAYDDRGTGSSGPLSCPGIAAALTAPPAEGARLAAACARRLGSRRLFYSTRANVEDTDAVRRALGVNRIALYGVSYGTRHALAYAVAHPANVSRLVLDSVVPLDSSESFRVPTIRAIGGAYRDLCRAGTCATLSRDPFGDFARLANRLQRLPLVATLRPVAGRPRPVRVDGIRLVSLAVDTDLNPGIAAELPAAVAAALAGSPAPLERLAALDDVWASRVGVNLATEAATVCADDVFPWTPETPAAKRAAILASAAAALGPQATAPFGRWALQVGNAVACQDWPVPSGAETVAAGPLPNVPVLLLAGGRDMRTPAASARRVAARFPRSTLLVVPGAGHGVLFVSPCAARFEIAWWKGGTPAPCGREPLPLAPIEPFHRTSSPLAAVIATLHEAEATALIMVGLPGAVAGLEGGTFTTTGRGPFGKLDLKRYLDAGGIELSGEILFERSTAPHWSGVVTLTRRGARVGEVSFSHGILTGTLDGHQVKTKV